MKFLVIIFINSAHNFPLGFRREPAKGQPSIFDVNIFRGWNKMANNWNQRLNNITSGIENCEYYYSLGQKYFLTPKSFLRQKSCLTPKIFF